MKGRNYTTPSDSLASYRYGFNGKERDTNLGGGTHYDYGFRIYKPRIAKFLSVDPLTKSYPMLTPYQFASNTPIWAIDLDGLEAFIGQAEFRVMGGGEILSVTNSHSVGIIVGKSNKIGTIGISSFYTVSLGIGGGAGTVGGVIFASYPTASMEDFSGFGGNFGVFKGFVPGGVGPAVTGEINLTQNLELGFTYQPFKNSTVGIGVGGYIEGSYTFMSVPIPLSEALSDVGITDVLENLNISPDQFKENIDIMFKEVLEQRKEYYNKLLENYDPEQIRIIPKDNLNIELPDSRHIDKPKNKNQNKE